MNRADLPAVFVRVVAVLLVLVLVGRFGGGVDRLAASEEESDGFLSLLALWHYGGWDGDITARGTLDEEQAGSLAVASSIWDPCEISWVEFEPTEDRTELVLWLRYPECAGEPERYAVLPLHEVMLFTEDHRPPPADGGRPR